MTGFFYRQLAKASQQEEIIPGQNVSLKVDLLLAHDGNGPEILTQFREQDRDIDGCGRILLTLDHSFPAPTIKAREFQREISVFANRNSIHLYKNGEGVLHQIVAEEESLWPGMIIVGADGHVATAGAFGAIAFPASPELFVETICAGIYQTAVPEQVVVSLDGNLRPQVKARDVAMHIMHHCGNEIRDKAVLLTGNSIDQFNISEKMSVCNFLPEGGVRTALILPQGEQQQIDIQLASDEIRPMLAVPGNALTFAHPDAFSSEKISVAIAGGCSSGRLDDMRTIADILTKNEVHPDVTFIITPASRNVMDSMDKLNLSSILRNAGAVIMPPGCGPCPGKHFGVLCETDTAITTTIRSNPGRIGAEGAKIYLASPLTVALSSVNGRITEPQ
ncbi:MAG: 3-isopropylmalate dehydratase [Desulfobacterales bacterium]|nr:3-isopropylmalate dehydratase [Deltaproteobacteria bacterium]NNK94241.1 3-isopropylmalate dehydratase [Desulfobacterales bacterium]